MQYILRQVYRSTSQYVRIITLNLVSKGANRLRVDFGKLRSVLASPTRKTNRAYQSTDCLSEFTASLTNYIEHNHGLTEEQSAMFIMSIENWMRRKQDMVYRGSGSSSVGIGEVFYADLGINYKPEVGHPHPVVILEEIGNMVLVVPVTTSTDVVNNAYHPVDNPTGNKYARKVNRADGFGRTSAVILSNMRTISKGRLLDRKGALTNINDPNSLFAEIKEKCFEFGFPKHHINIVRLKSQVGSLELEKQNLSTEKLALEHRITELEAKIVELQEGNSTKGD